MEIDINQLAEYYSSVSIEFLDIYTGIVNPGSKSIDDLTSPDGCGLVFPLGGKANYSFNGVPYMMEPGKVFHAGPSMRLDKEVLGDDIWKYTIVHYQIFDRKSEVSPFANAHFEMNIGVNTRINDLLRQLGESYVTPGSFAALRVKALFLALIEEIILTAKRQLQDSNSDLIAQAVDYIHKYYMETISVSEIATEHGFEARRFAYLFQKYTGMSPLSYLTEYRMRRAKELLRLCQCSIAEISTCVGYGDPYYFSRLFKKHTGMSPSEFQATIGKNPLLGVKSSIPVPASICYTNNQD